MNLCGEDCATFGLYRTFIMLLLLLFWFRSWVWGVKMFRSRNDILFSFSLVFAFIVYFSRVTTLLLFIFFARSVRILITLKTADKYVGRRDADA